MFIIEFELKTKSSCLIGNQTDSFSIGGIDQATTVDNDGYPIIHGSAMKGCLRNIVREESKYNNIMPKTIEFLKGYLNELYKKYDDHQETNDIIENLKKSIKNFEENCKAEYIFGIEGLNTMPRLFFSDIIVKDKNPDKNYFIIETKNSIEEKDGKVEARPRTYKVIRPEIEFKGLIKFKDNKLCEKDMEEKIKSEVEKMLSEFNKGIYGIGNSKSRGYGNVCIKLVNK